VLRGGISAERDVSLAGGAAVARACRRLGYRVVEADIAPDNLAALDIPADVVFPVLHGRFGEDGRLQAFLEARGVPYVGSNAAASGLAMDKHAAKLRWRAAGLPTPDWMIIDSRSPRLLAEGTNISPRPLGEGSGVRAAERGEGRGESGEEASDAAESARTANRPHPNPLTMGEGTDIISPCSLGEGTNISPRPLAGEGPGVRASGDTSIAHTSNRPHPNPLPMGEGIDIISPRPQTREGRFAFTSRLIIKPVSEGSSIGVTPCDTLDDLPIALARIVKLHGSAMVERRLDGPELTVGILGDKALPAVEIQPHRNSGGLFDYQAKYQSRETVFSFDPQLDADTLRSAQEAALAAFRALGCRDYGRVDIIVDRRDGPQLLEINTIPGFTARSLLPKAAMHGGMDFEQLVGELVGLALRRGG
jgi:D-alanine-D-alanine ligase-like ATP-grasp enzyme